MQKPHKSRREFQWINKERSINHRPPAASSLRSLGPPPRRRRRVPQSTERTITPPLGLQFILRRAHAIRYRLSNFVARRQTRGNYPEITLFVSMVLNGNKQGKAQFATQRDSLLFGVIELQTRGDVTSSRRSSDGFFCVGMGSFSIGPWTVHLRRQDHIFHCRETHLEKLHKPRN